MRILMTGTTGLLGRALAASLGGDHDVWGIVRTQCAPSDRFTAIPMDLSMPLDSSALPSRMDVVFHLAQSTGYRHFPERAHDMFDVNLRSTMSLLDYARAAGVRKFVFASSGGVYGGRPGLLSEDRAIAETEHLDFHLKIKYFGEQLVHSHRSFFETVILRIFFMYGPGQRKEMLVPRLFESVRRNEPVTVVGTDGPILTPTFVSDVAEATARVLDLSGHHVINIAARELLSLRAMTQIIAEEQGKSFIIHSLAGQPSDLIPDTRLMEKLLGFRPAVSFREGVRRIIAGSGDNEPCWRE